MVIYKRYRNIEELEFELLEEVKVNNLDLDKNLIDKFCGFITLSNYWNFGIVVKVLGDKILLNNNGVFYSLDKINYCVGDILVFDENKIFKIEKGIFEHNFLEDLEEFNVLFLKLSDWKKDIITQKEFKQEVLRIYNNYKKEQEKEKLRKEQEDKQEKEEEENRERDFKEKSICDFVNLKVNKKTILKIKSLYTFKKNVNKLFEYDVLDNRSFGWNDISNLSSFESFIIKNKMNYTKERIKEDNTKIKLYDLEFERDTKKEIISNFEDKEFINYPKIKGIRIPQNKLGFLLSKIHKEPTEEQIKLLKKLTGMKMDLLGMKKIECNSYEVEISISLIDENNFELEFMNKKKTFEWELLKEILFYGRSIQRYLGKREFLSFCEKFDLKKKEVFDYIKKLKMLKELK